MTTSRDERLVENEKLFRGANERLQERAQSLAGPEQPIPFLCECIDETCMARVELTLRDYERVRADDDHFVIVRGHPLLDGERVVETNGNLLIVTKEDIQ